MTVVFDEQRSIFKQPHVGEGCFIADSVLYGKSDQGKRCWSRVLTCGIIHGSYVVALIYTLKYIHAYASFMN